MKKYTTYKCALVHWYCDKCDEEVRYTGWINTEDLAYKRYEHQCPVCKKKILLVNQFPYISMPVNLPDNVRKELKIKLPK